MRVLWSVLRVLLMTVLGVPMTVLRVLLMTVLGVPMTVLRVIMRTCNVYVYSDALYMYILS